MITMRLCAVAALLGLMGLAAAWGPPADLYLFTQNYGPSFCSTQRCSRQPL